MRKVIIGFSKPTKFWVPFSWAIRLVERTPYSHVYLKAHSDSLDVDLVYQASGLQVNFMGLKIFNSAEKTIYEFEADMDDAQYNLFMRWAINSSGAPYSVKQVLGIAAVKLFNLSKNPFSSGQKAWVCSELAGYVLNSFVGVKISADALDTAGPKEIFDICNKFLKPIEVT